MLPPSLQAEPVQSGESDGRCGGETDQLRQQACACVRACVRVRETGGSVGGLWWCGVGPLGTGWRRVWHGVNRIPFSFGHRESSPRSNRPEAGTSINLSNKGFRLRVCPLSNWDANGGIQRLCTPKTRKTDRGAYSHRARSHDPGAPFCPAYHVHVAFGSLAGGHQNSSWIGTEIWHAPARARGRLNPGRVPA